MLHNDWVTKESALELYYLMQHQNEKDLIYEFEVSEKTPHSRPLLMKTCGNNVGFYHPNKCVFGQPLIEYPKYDGFKKEINDDHSTLLNDRLWKPPIPKPDYIESWRDASLKDIMEHLTLNVLEVQSKYETPAKLYGTLVVKGPTMEPMVFTKA